MRACSCTFEQLDGNAMYFYGYGRDIRVENNLLREIGGWVMCFVSSRYSSWHLIGTGDNMIGLHGVTTGAPAAAFDMGWDGREGNQPRHTIIKNNFA